MSWQCVTAPSPYPHYFLLFFRSPRCLAGKVLFNIANLDDFRGDMEEKFQFSNAAEEKGIVVGLRDGTTYFKMDGKFSVDNMGAFVADFVAGSLTGNDAVRAIMVPLYFLPNTPHCPSLLFPSSQFPDLSFLPSPIHLFPDDFSLLSFCMCHVRVVHMLCMCRTCIVYVSCMYCVCVVHVLCMCRACFVWAER